MLNNHVKRSSDSAGDASSSSSCILGSRPSTPSTDRMLVTRNADGLEKGLSGSMSNEPHIGDSERKETVIDCSPENRWLLVCSDTKYRPISLTHINISAMRSDQELFEDLRRTYLNLRNRWSRFLSMKRILAIRFIQVFGTRLVLLGHLELSSTI